MASVTTNIDPPPRRLNVLGSVGLLPLPSYHSFGEILSQVSGASFTIVKSSAAVVETKGVSPNLASGLTTIGEGRPKFFKSRELETKLSSDLAVREFFRIVESNVRELADNLNLDWEFEASIQTDIETPWWERVVLRLTPMDGDFEKSMELWDQIDTEVRRAIELAKKNIEPSISKKISQLNKNFFIEMNLG